MLSVLPDREKGVSCESSELCFNTSIPKLARCLKLQGQITYTMKTLLKVLPMALLFGMACSATQAQKMKDVAAQKPATTAVAKKGMSPTKTATDKTQPVATTRTATKSGAMVNKTAATQKPIAAPARTPSPNTKIARPAVAQRPALNTKPLYTGTATTNGKLDQREDSRPVVKGDKRHAKQKRKHHVPNGKAIGWHRMHDGERDHDGRD